jgi:hypothetical protein
MFPFSFQAIKVQLMMMNRVFLYGKRNRNEKHLMVEAKIWMLIT